jgi:hypothetical protein
VPRKTKSAADIVAAVAANVKKKWPATCKDITIAYGVSNGTKHNILSENQKLIKEWFFHWNKILVPTADIVPMWMTTNKIQLLQHPSYLLDLASEAYFFFWGVKEVLAGDVLTLESSKKIWKGSAETSALTSSPLPSGGSWTAATGATGSTMDKPRIFRNKHPANNKHSIFIYVFQFDFECTSYVSTGVTKTVGSS